MKVSSSSPRSPAIAGIALAGMSNGSPGMGGRKAETFTIHPSPTENDRPSTLSNEPKRKEPTRANT